MKELAQRLAALSPEQRALYELRLKQRNQRSLAAQSIPRRPAGERCLQSVDQARLWFMYQLDPDSAAYNVSTALRLRGLLDQPALLRSLNTIIARHEVLRTTYADDAGQPVQIVAPDLELAPALHDLRDLPPSEHEAAVHALLVAQAQQPFDLQSGPVLRALLVRLADEEHLFAVTIHHIATDWWSFNLLQRELLALYDAFAQSGLEAALPELPIQFADFALWQHQWLQNPALQAQLEYWKTQLGGDTPAPASLELPADRPRPSFQSWRGARHDLALSPAVSAALATLCQSEGVTPFMALLAIFKTLLYRYTAQPDLVVGAPIANRSRAETEPLIGFFVNTLVLRTDLSGNPTFRELLARVRHVTLQAYAHQDLPFGTLVNQLQVARDTSRMPIVQIGFLTVAQDPPLHAATLAVERLDFDPGVALFDLSLAWRERPEGPSGFFEYNTDLFDAATIARLADHLQQLTASLVADPEQRVDGVPLLSAAEQAQLARWNATDAPYPAAQTLPQLFAAQAARTPDALALVTPGGDRTRALSYHALETQAMAVAQQLQALGVGPDTLVGIMLPRSVELVIGLLGIGLAGGAYLPLDPSYPAARLQFMLTDARPRVLLTTTALQTMLPLDEIGPELAVLCLDRELPPMPQPPRAIPPAALTPDHLAYVIYTSGSTGQPKGVLATHRATINRLAWMWTTYPFGLDECGSHKTALSFVDSVAELWGPLLQGVPVVLLADEIVKDPAALIATLAAQRVTRLVLVPALLHALLTTEPLLQARLPLLRLWSVSGEALPADLLRSFAEHLPDCTLLNLYGSSEVAADATWYDTRQPLRTVNVPIGRPLANMNAYVLDDRLRLLPVGVPGELYIGGVQLARGYLNQPALTAARFLPDPWSASPGARLYRTGDLARWLPDGNLEYCGRRDHQRKLRGYRVELGEIEGALRQHPAVRAAAVDVQPLELPGGYVDQQLVAYVVAQEPTQHQEPGAEDQASGNDADGSQFSAPGAVSVSELRAFLAERLPGYMIPSTFVQIDALPQTPSGKLDRRALAALAQPDRLLALETAFVAPRTPVEQALAALWSELLGRDRVGIVDNFFALGGHSLLATQMVTRLRGVFGVELPLRVLFEAPTVADLALHVERARRVTADQPPILPARRDQALPLSFAQERLWFLQQLEPQMSAYHIPAAVRLSGEIDIKRLERSLNQIVARHETLRTTFAASSSADGDRPVQLIAAALPLRLSLADLRALPAAEREDEARRQAQVVAHQPFDLRTGPLVRAALWQLSDQQYLLLIVLHHIIADGWSLGVLLRELAALYAAAPLAELPIQYVDFAVWQRHWLAPEGPVLDVQLRYWQSQLADAPFVLELPLDYPRPATASFRGARQTVKITSAQVATLQALGEQERATLYMTLLALFATLLHRWTGQADLLIGAPIANRTRAETEPLIGFFVNTLVLRADLEGNPTFRELVGRVRTTALDAYAHQDLPFEQLVEQLAPPRDLSCPPLVQVLFVLQNAPLPTLELSGLTLEPVEIETGAARFDLTLELSPAADGLIGALEYNTDLFESATIARMIAHLHSLLDQLLDAPDRRIGALPLLSAAEQAEVAGWNATGAPYPAAQTLPQLFAAQAARTPDALALVEPGGDGARALSYRALETQAMAVAQQLQALGVGPDTLVGIMLPRSVELVIGLLGIGLAGGAYLPLDPSYPAARLQFMLTDARPRVLLTTTALQTMLPLDEIGPELAVLCLDRELPQHDETRPALSVALMPDHLAYVIYTSGSTGQPKGIAMTQRALLNMLAWQAQQFDSTPARTLQLASISFDVAFQELFSTWHGGGTVVLIPEELRADMPNLLRCIAQTGISRLFLPFVSLHHLAEVAAQESLELPQLREIITAGEQLQITHPIGAWLAGSPHSTLTNQYGPSETHVATAYTLLGDPASWPTLPPIGRPIANTQIHLLDAYLQPVPVGVVGELYIGGVALARGYVNRPALTAARFLPDPWSVAPGARLYRTGDLARYRPDGTIDFLGRSDQQLKVRGFRVEPGEIEAVLQRHPAIREAVVAAHPAADGTLRLVAYVVEGIRHQVSGMSEYAPEEERTLFGQPRNQEPGDAADGSQLSMLDSGALRAFLQEHLPEHMIPSVVVRLDALPLTPSGKLDRRALPVPEQRPHESVEPGQVARTPVEELLTTIWADVLGLERVGVADNFFALGGHSLLATRLMSHIQRAFQVELPLRALFTAPTVAALAQEIEQARGLPQPSLPPLLPGDLSGPLPLSYTQAQIWRMEQLIPGTATYNIPATVRLRGVLDVPALEGSLMAIVQRHAVLRARCVVVDSEPHQIVAPELALVLPVHDLAALPESVRAAEAQRLLTTFAQQPFDLQRGPLIRCVLLRLADDEHVLTLVLHHFVADGWSLGVLARELSARYACAVASPSAALAPDLPALPVQYPDVARWQRRWLAPEAPGAALERLLEYWLQQLAGAPTVLSLPTDWPRPAVRTTHGAQLQRRLSAALSQQTRMLARREGCTLFMTLLAAFNVALAHASGQRDLLVATPIAGRTRAETEDLIGVFINMLVLRTRLAGAATFRELLGHVRETALQAYAHQDLPFAMLLDALALPPDPSRRPLVQICFNMLNLPELQLDLPGLTVQGVPTASTGAKYELTLYAHEQAGQIQLEAVYNADLFAAERIAALLDHLEQILEQTAADPTLPVAQLGG